MHSCFRGQRRASLIHGVIHRCFLRPLTPSCPTVHFHRLSSKKYKKILPSLLSSQLSLSQSLELKKKKIPISFPHCSPPREGTILICHLYFARKNQGALEPKAAVDSWEGRENLTCPVLLRARHAPWGSQRPWKDRDVSFLCCLGMHRGQGPGVLKTPLHRWPLSFRSEVCEFACKRRMLLPQEWGTLLQNSEDIQRFSWSHGTESRGGKCLVLAEMLGRACRRCIRWS